MHEKCKVKNLLAASNLVSKSKSIEKAFVQHFIRKMIIMLIPTSIACANEKTIKNPPNEQNTN